MLQTICICGAGTMGSGIAQVAASAGFYTILYDHKSEVLEKAKAGIESDLQKLVLKNKITNKEKDKTLQNFLFTNDLHHCLADVIIEAIVEKTEAKIALFNQLAEINHSETVFATNTSSLSITNIAQKVMCPQRVIGMHFFNPAPVMKLVEIVTTNFTDQQTINIVKELADAMNKTTVLCKDSPGFIVNRVARPFYLEALRLAEQGVPYEMIDSLIENAGFKMGPFRLMDLIGNDINFAVSNSVYEQLNKPSRLKPSIIQKEKVQRGELGKKSGKGYYSYS